MRALLDLSGTGGLPLWLDVEQRTLTLAQPMQTLRSEPHTRARVRRVLMDPQATAPDVLSWEFRGVALPTDEGVFDEHRVRHDVLMLQPGRVGIEFIKTLGHASACADGSQCPEAYGVLHGRALFLLQRNAEALASPSGGIAVLDVRWIKARVAEKIIVPAGFGVVVANLGEEPLVLSCLVASDTHQVRAGFERMQGAAYYAVEREGAVLAEPNRRYTQPLPDVHEEAPLRAPEMGVEDNLPLYSAFVHQPDQFHWLKVGVPLVSSAC